MAGKQRLIHNQDTVEWEEIRRRLYQDFVNIVIGFKTRTEIGIALIVDVRY